jgi:hypothetical protein
MAYLITPAEFATFRNISKKIDEDKINEDIGLAQQSDLVNILGDFYFDVLKNSAETAWLPLMNGSTFECSGEEFQHQGIKKLLADYTHARYVYSKNAVDTPFGMVTKDYQDGTPVDRNLLKDLSKQDQIDAGIKFRFIEKYILTEPELFSRYCKNKNQGTSFNFQRFSKL